MEKPIYFLLHVVPGKSTHTKQWQKYFGADQAIIINDDKPVLRRLEDGWYAYGTPFSGKTDENVNKKVKLQGICMLERGENRIRQIQPGRGNPSDSSADDPSKE